MSAVSPFTSRAASSTVRFGEASYAFQQAPAMECGKLGGPACDEFQPQSSSPVMSPLVPAAAAGLGATVLATLSGSFRQMPGAAIAGGLVALVSGVTYAVANQKARLATEADAETTPVRMNSYVA